MVNQLPMHLYKPFIQMTLQVVQNWKELLVQVLLYQVVSVWLILTKTDTLMQYSFRNLSLQLAVTPTLVYKFLSMQRTVMVMHAPLKKQQAVMLALLVDKMLKPMFTNLFTLPVITLN